MESLTQVQIDKLIEDHLGLVYFLANKVRRNLPIAHDFDDLVGYGMVGLVEAANHYKPSKGTEFTTFAFPRINGSIYDGVSKLSWMSRARYSRLVRKRRMAELDEDLDANELEQQSLINVSSLTDEVIREPVSETENSVENQFYREEEGERLGLLIAELPDRERLLIQLIYIEGVSLVEASDRIGVSKSWGSRMHQNTLEKLGKSLDNPVGKAGRSI